MSRGEFDIRELPSWKYFAWGLLNGLFVGISIKDNIDISKEGILVMILDAFRPLLESANISTGWITAFTLLIGLLGLLSLIVEGIAVYQKGWPARIIATCGFLSLLLIILGVETLGVILLLLGGGLVVIFPDE